MIYNILSYHPFLSLIFAIFSLMGLSIVGSFFLKLINVSILNSKFHEPIIGAVIVAQFVFIFSVFGLFQYIFLIGILMIFLSIFYLLDLKKINIFKFRELQHPFCLLLLSLYFLYSLTPLTNADSIDYHIGLPIYLLENNLFPKGGEWFHSRLFGFGEYINLLGISIKTLNLGSMIQFLSLLSIYFSITSNIKSNSKAINSSIRLSIISMPVLIFLISTSKFQLLPIALIVLSINIFINNWREFELKLKVFLILFLCMSATLFKFNYLLPAFIISLMTLLRVFIDKKNDFYICFVISIFTFIAIMLPFYAYKAYLFNASIFESFLSPVVGSFIGSNNFLTMLQSYNESSFMFPFSILIPDSIGKITSVLGIGFFLVLFLRKKDLNNHSWLLSFLFLLLFSLLIFAQYTARTFLDFYFVLLILLARSIDQDDIKINIYKYFISTQSVALMMLLVFGVTSSISGIFSKTERIRIMNNQANGFEIMNWIDSQIPKDSYIIVTNRSMSFSTNKMIAGDWIDYVNWNSTEPFHYLDKIPQQDELFIFYIKNSLNEYNIPLKLLNCLNHSKSINHKDFKLAVRNPFNAKKHKVFLLRFDNENLKKCLNKN
jgi:hypothetical protein